MKKFTIMKKFLKSKKGNYVILAIALIPIILTIVATTVCNQRNKTVYISEIKSSLSTFLEYENNHNSIISVRKSDDGTEVFNCIYSKAQRDTIKNDFKTFFQKIDGYNKFWSYSTIEYPENNGNYSLTIKCVIYLPKITTLRVIDYWGIESGTFTTTDGWYQKHASTLANLLSKEKDENGNIEGWQKLEIEVSSSCV